MCFRIILDSYTPILLIVLFYDGRSGFLFLLRSILTDDFIQTVCQNGTTIDVSRKKNVSPIAIKIYNIGIFVDATSNSDSSHMILTTIQIDSRQKHAIKFVFSRSSFSRSKLFYWIRLDLNTFAKRARNLSLKPMLCQSHQFKGIRNVGPSLKCALNTRIVFGKNWFDLCCVVECREDCVSAAQDWLGYVPIAVVNKSLWIRILVSFVSITKIQLEN